jgi:serine/threonine protein kinase
MSMENLSELEIDTEADAEGVDIKRETTPGEKENFKNPDDFFEEILRTSPIIASGKDGIILQINTRNFNKQTIESMRENGMDISADDGYALKILKIYRQGSGEREYNIQKTAYELLKNIDGVAKIPKPIIIRTQHLSESDKRYFEKYAPFIDDKAEMIFMDYIEGKDLATYIYDFILSKHGYDDNLIQNMEFEQKQETINGLINFEIPENKISGDFKDIIAMRDNVRKLMNYLKKSDFHIDKNILDQIQNALGILESKRIFHNDLHERNIIISNNDGLPYIIDFGRSVDDKNKQENDDMAVIRRYKELNKEESIDNLKDWENLINRVSKLDHWIQVSQKWKNFMNSNKENIVFETILSSTADESYFFQLLATLANLITEENKKIILNIIDKLNSSLKKERLKKELGNLRFYLTNK